jgi:Ca-activated chloride channel family protein
VQCPLTVDYEAFKLMTEASSISPPEEQGTDIAQAFKFALDSLKYTRDSQKVIVLITDGEDHSGEIEEILKTLIEQKITVFTFGVGSLEGAPIPLKDKSGKTTGWKKDKEGNMVKTVMDATILSKIASNTEGKYFPLADIRDIAAFIDELKNYERNILSKKMELKKTKRYYFPLIIGLLILLLEMVLTERKINLFRSEDKQK